MSERKKRFFTASDEQIQSGSVTDVYFLRTKQVLEARGLNKHVRVEVVAKGLPSGYEWAIFAGLEDVLHLLDGCPVSVEGLPEGRIFQAYQPVLSIEGRYLDFGLHETALLGFLCQASGVATKAARIRRLVGDKPLIHFGARRMHPAIAPMIDRSAYLGGCDGVAVVLSADLLGLPPSGTIPHALILQLGDTLEAARAFHEIIDPTVRRVALIDTFQDEKFEAIRLAQEMGRRFGRYGWIRPVLDGETLPKSFRRCVGNLICAALRTSNFWCPEDWMSRTFQPCCRGRTRLGWARRSPVRRWSTSVLISLKLKASRSPNAGRSLAGSNWLLVPHVAKILLSQYVNLSIRAQRVEHNWRE